MNLEAIILASVPGLLALAAIIVQEYRNRNKADIDRANAASDNVDTSLKLRAEMKAERDEVRARLDTQQDELDALHKDFRIIISFARVHYEGSKILYNQVLPYETPKFIPAEKFPTGDLGRVIT